MKSENLRACSSVLVELGNLVARVTYENHRVDMSVRQELKDALDDAMAVVVEIMNRESKSDMSTPTTHAPDVSQKTGKVDISGGGE